MEKKPLIFLLSFLSLAVIIVASYFLARSGRFLKFGQPLPGGGTTPKLEKFTSEQDFKTYLEEAQLATGSLVGQTAPRFDVGISGLGAFPVAERISETTVQVVGIDEPDIVKTDGSSIFFSGEVYLYSRGVPPLPKGPETKVIKAFPPTDLVTDSTIDKYGNLLLNNQILIIFSGNQILGYDVTDTKKPFKKWGFELEDNNQIIASRLYQGKLFIVTRTSLNSEKPCPIPLIKGGTLTIGCVDIYHPSRKIPVDSTFSTFGLNPETGVVTDKVAFIGSSGTSVVYMSKNAIFVTYNYYGSLTDFIYGFYSEESQDLIPSSLLSRLDKLRRYDISELAKITELTFLLENYRQSLTNDEKMRIQNEVNNRMKDYAKKHARDLEKTGLAKIDVNSLKVLAVGEVPGRPLNQFSLDEYQEHLRLATTVGGNWLGFGIGESENDVYILDKNLSVVGQVQGMGLTERIYSVRFIENKGYVVTFRQTDPFYVLDLSNPASPKLAGELKIPGYSAYLHPITKDKILGIGKEDNQVKVSLFDTAKPESPTELSKYTLDEPWSDILNTHHAFLLDSKHEVFFLPGSKGGYIFSYQGNSLTLTKAVSDVNVKRAIYLEDYLYIIGSEKITVLNESDWEKVNSLTF